MISCFLILLLRIATWPKICIEKTHSPIFGDNSEHELDNVSFVVHYHIYSDLCAMQFDGRTVELKY